MINDILSLRESNSNEIINSPNFLFVVCVVGIELFHEIKFRCFPLTTAQDSLLKAFSIACNKLGGFVDDSTNVWWWYDNTSNFPLFCFPDIFINRSYFIILNLHFNFEMYSTNHLCTMQFKPSAGKR